MNRDEDGLGLTMVAFEMFKSFSSRRFCKNTPLLSIGVVFDVAVQNGAVFCVVQQFSANGRAIREALEPPGKRRASEGAGLLVPGSPAASTATSRS